MGAIRSDTGIRVSLKIGYRIIVREGRWRKSVEPGQILEINTVWRNTGMGRIPFKLQSAAYLLDEKRNAVALAVSLETAFLFSSRR